MRYLVGAGDMIASAVLLHPRRLPSAPEGVFVQVAPKHNQQWDQIECWKHSHSDHELD